MSGEPSLAVGFCPFCRESFEGVARCPDHDLVLVKWTDLPPDALDPDAHVARPGALAHGRGFVLGASATMLLGFFMPVLAVGDVSTTGALLAMEHAPNAWIIPACAFAAMAVVLRRKTPTDLRSARFVVVFFGLVVIASMLWTSRAVIRGASHAQTIVEPRVGAYVLALAVLAFVLSPLALGRQVESGR